MVHQIGKKAYNERTDIWALGCILYEMACLHTPFEAHNEAVLAAKIKAGRIHKLPSCYSDALARAIYSMIQVDMAKRPRIQDLLALPQVATRLAQLNRPNGAAAEPAKHRPTTAAAAADKYKNATAAKPTTAAAAAAADKYKPAAAADKYKPATAAADKYKPAAAAAAAADKYKPAAAADKYKPAAAAAAADKYATPAEADKRPTVVVPTRQAPQPTRPSTAVGDNNQRDREDTLKAKESELSKRESAVATRERQVTSLHLGFWYFFLMLCRVLGSELSVSAIIVCSVMRFWID